MTYYYISLIFAFAIINFLPAMGAYYFARYLNRGSYSELFLLSFAIYFIEVIISYGIPGISGHLNYITCGVISSLIGASLCLFKNLKKPIKSKPFNFSERLLTTLIIAAFLLRSYWASTMHGGTDTYFYHFYYPAMWLTEGRIFPVSMAGFPHEYYPAYGEFLYGWLMLPFGDTSFTIFLQLLSCIMACCAISAVARAFDFRRVDGLVAACFMVFCSMIAEISILGYTDVLNGSFLLSGFAIMIIGALRNNIKFAIIAGAMLGCSASIKFSGLLLSPILCFIFLIIFIYFRRKLWRYSLFLASSAVIAAAPCYIVNMIRTSNPFYPVKISIAGISIFSAGLDFSRPATGFNSNTWRAFVNSNLWDMNLTSGILYLALPFLVIALFCFHRKFLKKQILFLFLALTIILLLVIQICYYPAMAQARQIIPLLMLSTLLFIPISKMLITKEKSFKYNIGIAIVIGMCILLSYTVDQSDIIVLWVFISILALALTFWSDKIFRYCCVALIVLFIISLPYFFQLRIVSKNMHNYTFAGKAGGKCIQIVWDDFNTRNKPIKIASVGSWYNYMFMTDMPGNKVVYVPINEKNSSHLHEFDSYKEMRDKPVSFTEWHKRLKKQKIDYLIIELFSDDVCCMTNKYQEIRWAKSHPEYFEKLIDNDELFFFRLNKVN